MLLQVDGSRHNWLEEHGPCLTLLGMIDDANNELGGAAFRAAEGAAGYFLVFQQVCLSKGLPQALYAGRHTSFQSPNQARATEAGVGEVPGTQFWSYPDQNGSTPPS
jgi:hypothetical protein